METQEAKLKKIRAMRGQVDYSKLINGNLCKPEHTKHAAEMMTVAQALLLMATYSLCNSEQ